MRQKIPILEILWCTTPPTMLIFLFCFLTFISGCATSHKVNQHALVASRDKTFKLGVVKAAGAVYWDSGLSFKQKALERIPIDEIADTLKEEFGLTVDIGVKKTPRAVKEPMNGGTPAPLPRGTGGGMSFSINVRPPVENAYYGSLDYENPNMLWLLLGSDTSIVDNNDISDIVNVTYSLEEAFWSKTRYLYFVEAKSSGQEVLNLRGIVETIPTPKKMIMVNDVTGIWEEYVKYAAEINAALKRDLAETSKSNH